MIALIMLSCSSDDENIPLQTFISFNLDGVNYFLTEYQVTLHPLDENFRMIEASFDNNSKTIRFFVLLEETNQIDEFIFINNDRYYTSDVNFGDRETSITTHTDSNMEGTFRVTTDAISDKPVFTFTNGMINIEY